MNINRDYLIINDVKKSNVKLDNGSIFFYITDKNTQNIFVNLVINVSNNDLIQKYANIENAEDYTLTMNIVKPSNTYKVVEGKLHDKEKAIFEFNLNEDCCDEIGTYRCELLTKCNINNHEEITTSNKLTYKVKSSILNDLDDIVEAPEYPLVIQLFDKLSDLEQYEEDRRANELARQLAEEQRQTRFDTLDANITDRIEIIDNKLVEIDNVLISKEDIADIKAKNTEQDRRLDVAENRLDNINTNIENVLQPTVQRVDAIEAINTIQNDKLDAIEVKNTQQDNRLDIAENRLDNIGNDITNTMQPIIDAHTSRLDAIEAVDVSQNTRLDAIEAKNQQQDDRLLDIEKVNNRQDIDIKCLYGASQTIDVTKEGNSIYLQNSNNGFTIIDEIKGNTLVNCNKEPDKELILNGNINTSGYSNITLTEGVDGGLVDVVLEGNTLVNVCDQKDPVAITKSYTVQTGNHVALQGEYDGKCRPVVTGNTLVNLSEINTVTLSPSNTMVSTGISMLKPSTTYTSILNIKTNTLSPGDGTSIVGALYVDNGNNQNKIELGYTGVIKSIFTTNSDISSYNFTTRVRLNSSPTEGSMEVEEILLEGDYTNKPTPEYFEGLQSSFEDKVVTQEMVDNGEEEAENLGKYKVDYVISREDGTIGQTKTFYLNSPLLEGDTIEQQGDNVVHAHRSELRAYQTDDELTLPTDKTNTLVAKATPTYEVISTNDTILCDSYVNGHLDVDSAVPVEKVDFLHFEEDLTYLYANTQYTVQFTSDKAVTVDITLGGTKLLAQSIIVGLNKIAITTPSTLADNKLIINGVGANISEVVVTPATDQDFGYFEGMKSVGECEDLEVISCNKNLFDGNVNLEFYNNTKVPGTDRIFLAKPLNPNSQHTINIQSYVNTINNSSWSANMGIAYTDGTTQGNYLNYYIEKGSITSSPDKTIDYFYIRDPWKTKSIITGLQIEEGSTATDYIPHASNTQSLTHEPLRAVGDIKDKYVLIDGKWYIERNCGVRAYQEGDIDNYITDMINTVYPLSTPTYEPIDYNPFTVYSSITHISNNSTIPCNMTIKNTGYNCLLKPNTTYTVSSNLGLNTVTTPTTLTEDCLRFYDTDTSDVTTMKNVMVLEGDYTTGKPIPNHFSGIESAFEQEYDEEKGKHKVEIRVQNEDASKENYIEFYINEPLRGIGDVKDKVYVKDDKVVVERKCGQREYQDGDFGAYLTDKVNTVYQLASPTYEEVEYNDVKLFIESFKNSTLFYNSNVPVTSKLYYSYSIPLVDTVAQTADISNQQDSMIIDLATQCAIMEMYLM